MSDNELKPCPFCGSTNIVPAPLSDYEWYRCLGCDALSGHDGVEGWNKRPIEDAIREDRDSHQRAAISALDELAAAQARIDELAPQCDAAYAPYRQMVMDARAEVDKVSDERDAAQAREARYREALKHARIAMHNYIQRADMDDAGVDCDVMPTDEDVETAIAEAFIHVSAALAEKP